MWETVFQNVRSPVRKGLLVGKPENGGVELFADAEKRRFFSVFLKVLLDNRSGSDILAQIRKNAESFVASIAKLYKQGRAADET